MELLSNLIWYYPAVALSWWTLGVIVVTWLMPLNSKVPYFASVHPMMLIINPKDEFLRKRPSVIMALGFFALGVIPLVNFLLLMFQLFVSGVAAWEYLKQAKRKKPV